MKTELGRNTGPTIPRKGGFYAARHALLSLESLLREKKVLRKKVEINEEVVGGLPGKPSANETM